MRWIEAGIIVKAFDEADGDRKLAAQRLGIGLSSLYRRKNWRIQGICMAYNAAR